MTEMTERIIEAARLAKESLEALTDEAILNGDKLGLAEHRANLVLAEKEIRDCCRPKQTLEFREPSLDPLLWRPGWRFDWRPGSDPFNIAP